MTLNSYIFIEFTANHTPLSQCSFNIDSSRILQISQSQLSDNAAATGGICSTTINGAKYLLFLAPNSGPLNGYMLPILRYGSESEIPTQSSNIEWTAPDGTAVPCTAEGVIVAEPVNGYPSTSGSLANHFKPIAQDLNGNWCGATCNVENGALNNVYLSPIIGILDSDMTSLNIMQNVYGSIYTGYYQVQQAVSLATTIFNFVMSFFAKKSK